MEIPQSGIPQGSIIGPGICNLILDGLQEKITEVKSKLPNRVKVTPKHEKFLLAVKKKHNITVRLNPETDLNFLRYADDFIVFGYHSTEAFSKIRTAIVQFLAERGLTVKPETDKIFKFIPGTRFNFLGFTMIFPSRYKKKSEKGTFTKKRYSINAAVENRFSH
jgi:RNA-directed DNA polymerase